MIIRTTNGFHYFIDLPKSYIRLLNLRRKDKLDLILKRSTYQNSNRQQLELSLIVHHKAGRNFNDFDYSPMRSTCRIHVTKYMKIMQWEAGLDLNLSLDVNTSSVTTLTFDHEAIVYAVPDFTNLSLKDLEKRVSQYWRKGSRIKIKETAPIVPQSEHIKMLCEA